MLSCSFKRRSDSVLSCCFRLCTILQHLAHVPNNEMMEIRAISNQPTIHLSAHRSRMSEIRAIGCKQATVQQLIPPSFMHNQATIHHCVRRQSIITQDRAIDRLCVTPEQTDAFLNIRANVIYLPTSANVIYLPTSANVIYLHTENVSDDLFGAGKSMTDKELSCALNRQQTSPRSNVTTRKIRSPDARPESHKLTLE